MGVRILHDSNSNQAVLYCSTSDWAFGPVFQESGDHDAQERAEAFCRWLDTAPNWSAYDKECGGMLAGRFKDARELTQGGLSAAYSDWLRQEDRQYQRERLDELTKYGMDDLEPEERAEVAALQAVLTSPIDPRD